MLSAVGVLLAGVLALQYQSARRMASQVEALRRELAARAPEQAARSDERLRPDVASSGNAAILQRLSALEETVAQLVRNSEYLMERGQLPVTTNKVADLFTKFTDTAASDRDRLQALRLLRRNGGITEDALSHAMNWAQSATNAHTRDEILSSLEGLTNSVLRDPLLAFAINDPEVGRTAIQGLLDGPKSEARMAALQERASNPNSSLEERIVAWRALRTGNQDVQETSATLAQLAQSSQDPFERAKLMKAFDDAVNRPTSSDAVLLPPLLQGLQDSSPLVREPAARALRDYNADPNVQKWLRWAAENDSDPAVRKEAFNALNRR